jgi:hypothetical protein
MHLTCPVLPQLTVNLEFRLKPVLLCVATGKTAPLGNPISGFGNQITPSLGIDPGIRLVIHQSFHFTSPPWLPPENTPQNIAGCLQQFATQP